MKSLFKIDDIGKLFISFFTVCFIFLWDIKYNFFNARYLFLILLFPIVSNIYLEIRNGEFKFIIHFFYISIFLFFHLFINLFLDDKSIEFNYLGGIIFFLLIFVIVYYYNEKILNNLDLIILIFLLIFSSSLIYSLYNFERSTPFFCGGMAVPDFLIKYINQGYDYFFSTSGSNVHSTYKINTTGNNSYLNLRVTFKELIFKENSHLGMIAPSVIIYLIYKLQNKKLSIFYNCLFLLFLITCFIKSSTTFLAGTTASLFVISIFNFKKIPIRILITYILLFTICITIISTNKECRKRLSIKVNKGENFILNLEEKKKKYKRSIFDLPFLKKSHHSISSEVYFRSLLVAKYSIFKKPLGWGFNRYVDAFNAYNESYPPKRDLLNYLNNKDGSNIFVKLIVEFGIFSMFLFIFTLNYLASNNIKLEEKLFLMPIIITQMIRGAGYFNGGFLLIVLLIVFSYIRNRKKLQ